MFKALGEFQKWPGKTALVLDHSHSMRGRISGKSELSRADCAAALAILIREVCEEAVVYAYSGTYYGHSGATVEQVRPRRGFALRDEYMDSKVGWGNTDTGQAVARAGMDGYDRIILVTDEQTRDKVRDPLAGSKAYCINVASDENGIGYGKWMHIDGWSEACVQFIAQHEGLEMATERDEPED